jgi:molecular chaperone HscB
MNLQSTDFELFELPTQFAQDRAAIDARWKDLQRGAHPDKFAAQGPAAQRVAMQWSVRINEAYQRLKDPVKRAAYVCELNGHAVNAETASALPTEFLMEQMAWRESLEDCTTAQEIEQIGLRANEYLRQALSKAEQLMDQQHNYAAAAQAVRELMFTERFLSEVDARAAQLDP